MRVVTGSRSVGERRIFQKTPVLQRSSLWRYSDQEVLQTVITKCEEKIKIKVVWKYWNPTPPQKKNTWEGTNEGLGTILPNTWKGSVFLFFFHSQIWIDSIVCVFLQHTTRKNLNLADGEKLFASSLGVTLFQNTGMTFRGLPETLLSTSTSSRYFQSIHWYYTLSNTTQTPFHLFACAGKQQIISSWTLFHGNIPDM